jgi:hypothetical protein
MPFRFIARDAPVLKCTIITRPTGIGTSFEEEPDGEFVAGAACPIHEPIKLGRAKRLSISCVRAHERYD